jgi:hypothetical protein
MASLRKCNSLTHPFRTDRDQGCPRLHLARLLRTLLWICQSPQILRGLAVHPRHDYRRHWKFTAVAQTRSRCKSCFGSNRLSDLHKCSLSTCDRPSRLSCSLHLDAIPISNHRPESPRREARRPRFLTCQVSRLRAFDSESEDEREGGRLGAENQSWEEATESPTSIIPRDYDAVASVEDARPLSKVRVPYWWQVSCS